MESKRVQAELAEILARGFYLEAVFRAPCDYYPPGGEYVAVFSRVTPDTLFPQRLGFLISPTGIAAIILECDPGRIFPDDPATEYIFGRSK